MDPQRENQRNDGTLLHNPPNNGTQKVEVVVEQTLEVEVVDTTNSNVRKPKNSQGLEDDRGK
eukprot:scaffold5247_cov130-Cylindrotheca_fusiformis.AAC.3